MARQQWTYVRSLTPRILLFLHLLTQCLMCALLHLLYWYIRPHSAVALAGNDTADAGEETEVDEEDEVLLE